MCLSDHDRDTSVIYEKAKLVCFIYKQPDQVKFKSVQINMKQVSYYLILLHVFSFKNATRSPKYRETHRDNAFSGVAKSLFRPKNLKLKWQTIKKRTWQ